MTQPREIARAECIQRVRTAAVVTAKLTSGSSVRLVDPTPAGDFTGAAVTHCQPRSLRLEQRAQPVDGVQQRDDGRRRRVGR